MGVKWVGSVLDGSGYAEAGRNYVAALHTAGVEVTVDPIQFETVVSNFGVAGRIVRDRIGKDIDYSVKVIDATPENYPSLIEPGKYNVGFFTWETDRLPREWVPACNAMDEIWVPCQWNKEVCISSGVTRPVFVFGHCLSESGHSAAPPNIPGLRRDAYKFYSIFQWNERKNPRGLLLAYLMAFTKRDNVALILKTYRKDYSASEQRVVSDTVEYIKGMVGGPNLPTVHLITWSLTKDEILGLHQTGDCFALLHRSEGWGLPHHEALLFGKPVITTRFGGNLEFTKPEHSYLVDYSVGKVEGMDHIRWYEPRMKWAYPDVNHCRDLMQHVYANRAEAARKGAAGQKFVETVFSWETVGKAMKNRLEEIGARYAKV